MAASIEDLLTKLTTQADEQNLAWAAEFAKQDKHRSDDDQAASKAERAQAKYDKFATEQQGQEVQMSKKTQHHTADGAKQGKLLVDEQGLLTEAGKPRWNPKANVMSSDDADNIIAEGPKGSQMESLIHLAEGGKALNEGQQQLFDEQNHHQEDTKEAIDSQIKLTMKNQKKRLDHWVDQKADFSSLTGAIKTDFSLVFGSLGALTHLPGVNTILTASRTLLANMLKFFTGWLGPKLWQGLKDIKGWLIKQSKQTGLTDKFNKKKQQLLDKKDKFMTGGSFGGAPNRMRLRLGLAKPGKTTKGKPRALVPTRFGKVMASLLKPFMFIIKLLNPFKKMMLVAVLAVGGLMALFKGTDGKGLFAKLSSMWESIKSYFTDTIQPMLKSLWENVLIPLKNIFVNDILPMFGNIFEKIVKPLFFNVVVPLAKALGKIFKFMFRIFTWIYDRILKPVMKAFGLIDDIPVEDMDQSQLQTAARELNSQKDRLFGLNDKDRNRLFTVNQRLSDINKNSSGSAISDGNAYQSDFDLNRRNVSGMDNRNTLLAENKTNIKIGTKAFVSRTNASGMPAYGMQGRSIVNS